MSYVRPALLTDGDIVSTSFFRRLRYNWQNYETHQHADSEIESGADGGAIPDYSETGTMSIVRSRSDWWWR